MEVNYLRDEMNAHAKGMKLPEISAIHEIKHQVQAIAKQAIGRELRLQHIEAHIENAATSIRHAAPHARCECKGENEKCAACQGMGWVTKEQNARQA